MADNFASISKTKNQSVSSNRIIGGNLARNNATGESNQNQKANQESPGNTPKHIPHDSLYKNNTVNVLNPMNLSGDSDSTIRYKSNMVLTTKEFENQFIVQGTGDSKAFGGNQSRNRTEITGRLGEYQNEEDNIECGRFPHLKYCGCPQNCIENPVAPIEIVNHIYIGPLASSFNTKEL